MGLNKYKVRNWLGLTELMSAVKNMSDRQSERDYQRGRIDGGKEMFKVSLPEMTYLRQLWTMEGLAWPPDHVAWLGYKRRREQEEDSLNADT